MLQTCILSCLVFQPCVSRSIIGKATRGLAPAPKGSPSLRCISQEWACAWRDTEKRARGELHLLQGISEHEGKGLEALCVDEDSGPVFMLVHGQGCQEEGSQGRRLATHTQQLQQAAGTGSHALVQPALRTRSVQSSSAAS